MTLNFFSIFRLCRVSCWRWISDKEPRTGRGVVLLTMSSEECLHDGDFGWCEAPESDDVSRQLGGCKETALALYETGVVTTTERPRTARGKELLGMSREECLSQRGLRLVRSARESQMEIASSGNAGKTALTTYGTGVATMTERPGLAGEKCCSR